MVQRAIHIKMILSHKDHQQVLSTLGVRYKKQVLLADVNFPYKFSVDRANGQLYFCINADEAIDQSFQSVVLDLDSHRCTTVPGIRNGYATAVDQATGQAYLGGSDGIFIYNPELRDIVKPAIVPDIDIFEMFFKDKLYFVDTTSQTLRVFRNKNSTLLSVNHFIHYFSIDDDDDIFFVDSNGLYVLHKGSRSAILLDDRDINFRGITTDLHGVPHLVADDGIYVVDKRSRGLTKVVPLENGLALAFDRYNNMVYGENRSVVRLVPCDL